MISPDRHDQDGQRDARVHALIDRAVALYDNRRYREALALCDEVARLDPAAALPEIMRDECRRALTKRRRRWAPAVAIAAAVLAGMWCVYGQLARIRPEPPAGVLELAEMQQQRFTFTSGLGRHKALEFAWRLLDEDGHAAPAAEQRSLKHERNAPWSCTYQPAYAAVRASVAGQPATRRVVATGIDTAGGQMVRAEWVVRVRHVPTPPEILAVEPSPSKRIAIAPGGERAFRVEALDGDGATDLGYEWIVGDAGEVVGTGAAWTYRRPPRTAADAPASAAHKRLVVCRVANRAGTPLTRTLTWVVHLVALNRPPEIVGIKPHSHDLIRVRNDKMLSLLAFAGDPDDGDVLEFRWMLDGAVISVTEGCALVLPHDPHDAPKEHLLHLTVTDSCGARVERTWRVVHATE